MEDVHDLSVQLGHQDLDGLKQEPVLYTASVHVYCTWSGSLVMEGLEKSFMVYMYQQSLLRLPMQYAEDRNIRTENIAAHQNLITIPAPAPKYFSRIFTSSLKFLCGGF